ncbi:Predicted amino acid racemase [Paenimyroides aquimaris]|uniref:Predicted amino acid racemase n=1 Tax=Paenimyroides marinum TaxID=1159016 RepID=A0A1H6KH87_9FLAO|nr:alanine/ornithine racemase family PLP-dependent enzyme [Paenimyroides aquimaris]SEH74943.1 Predicted amino acid racemase [Paenimyroides aquimaris]
MAVITLHKERLQYNFERLDYFFNAKGIQWSVVTKMLCGNELFLKEILKLNPQQVCDSRVSNLKVIKKINPNIETIYIKPTPKRSVASVVKYADISMNTDINTIKLLSHEAQKQNKIHKIIIMIELGELREGVMREDVVSFYNEVFQLNNIEVVGIGTNLSCLYGVLPSTDKLIQLTLYKQLIEAKFNRKIPFVSGGSSVTIPLIFQHKLPAGINHFRVGETLYQGTDVYNDTPSKLLKQNVFTLKAEIIELIEKPKVPEGDFGSNVEGKTFSFDEKEIGRTSFRAILDLGILDVDQSNIFPKDKNIEFFGASSDMIIVDLQTNKKKYKVGDYLEFSLNYMGALRAMNSSYIEKVVQ